MRKCYFCIGLYNIFTSYFAKLLPHTFLHAGDQLLVCLLQPVLVEGRLRVLARTGTAAELLAAGACMAVAGW